MASSEITLEALPSVSQIAAADWDACANPAPDPNSLNGLDTLASSGAAGDSCIEARSHYNPFVSHAFFSALEESGSACARTGWGPRHLVAKLDGAIAGIVPCYLKSHSQGEYVFDRGWADAYERAGGRIDGAVRRHQGLLGSRHLCPRSRMEISRRARLPAANRPAIPLAQ